MKKIFAAVAFLLSINCCFAQDQPTPKGEVSPLVIPMFGNKPKTEAQQIKDEKFLSSSDKSFPNRQEASKFFMERGWEYFNEGQTDTAVYRFNLAWLLNPDNIDTHWAFGLVSANRGNQEQAIVHYEKALTFDPKNSLLLSDLASAYLSSYKNSKKKKTLKKASTYLSQSLAADTANAFALANMAVVKYYEEDYANSWEYLHKSREINMSQFDYEFLTLLMAKMPDPKGFFNVSAN